MYCGDSKKREKDPREKASWISIILFIFAFKTIRKGVRRGLDEDDIYEIMEDYRADKLGERLEVLWHKELEKPKPFLLRPIFKIFGVEYLILGIFGVIGETAIIVLEPVLIGKVVSYFEPGTKLTREEALTYTAGLITCTFLYAVFDHTYIFLLTQISVRIRIACCSLMYRKCLKLNTLSSPQSAGGKAVTLMTKDVLLFDKALDSGHVIVSGIVQVIFTTYVMYQAIGVAVLFGTSILFLMMPFDVYLGKKIASLRLRTAERTDQRVRLTQEILTAIRIIKMYTWELFFSKCVSILRKKEIHNLRILFYVRAVGTSIGELSSRVAFYICVMAYIAMGNHITAEQAFVVTGCFGALNGVLGRWMPMGIARIAELKTTIERITSFLLLEEVLENQNNNEYIEEKSPKVCVRKVTVKSDKEVEVLQDVSLEIKQGLTVLSGPTGSGKSTFLKLLLGDVKEIDGTVEVSGKISYASQEPWIFPGTVKQNIIFGEWLDEARYETILKVCALKKDLDTFPNGDRTCVTDRGLNLSRGQKARINLARAAYKKADIYLLDDCLSAVDTHVGKHIFHECIKGFLKDTICVLVTHQSQFLRELDNIIILSNGCAKFQGSYGSLKEWNKDNVKSAYDNDCHGVECVSYTGAEREKIPHDFDNADETTTLLEVDSKSRNVYEEKKQEGAVNKTVYYTYFTSGGGVKMLLLVVFLSIMTQVTASWSDYFVSFWVDTEQELSVFRFNKTTDSAEYKKLDESHDSIMKRYSFVILATTAFTLLRAFSFFIFSAKVSTNIHNSMLEKILNAGMIFFDFNLSGNVLNRFSRDLGLIDEQMPEVVFKCIEVTLSLLGILFVVSSVNLYFIIPSTIFTIILVLARQLYLPTSRSILRLEGATRSPVIGHLNATLEGLTTIRASKAQTILRKEFDKHQDLYNSVTYMNLATTSAFGFYLDMMSVFFITIITLTFLFIKTETLAGKVGLAITQSFSLTGLLQFGVGQWAALENQMTSVERVLEYKKIKPEEKSGAKLKSWPDSGRIVYTGVNLRYSSISERVLKDISFIVESRQKIGIVGRTGAGKSSIISTLFRMYEFTGTVTVDGVDINSVSIELLRSKISIIPQDPVLFSDTIRNNLDPYEEYSDNDLWDALEEVEMKKLVGNLNINISAGGSNFSIGQRQLLCLARAIIRKNIILVLDEATANVDPQTDSLIQRTIKRKFADCTVITIAHRLHTIMNSDRVLVMDSGNAVEYDNPKVLLENKNGMFYNMVREAGLL